MRVTPAAAQLLVSLETAARMTRDTGLATWAVVGRGPGVADKARSVARQLDLDVQVTIDSATIAVRFVKFKPPSRQ